MEEILVPYIRSTKTRLGLPNTQAILLIDCRSIHWSKAFLNWMKDHYQMKGHYHMEIHIHFMPANCMYHHPILTIDWNPPDTSRLQPNDWLLNCTLKHSMSCSAVEWMLQLVSKFLKYGKPVLSFPMDVQTLWATSVEWIDTATQSLAGRTELTISRR